MSPPKTKPRRARHDYTAVKHALLVGSVLASLAGARVLAWQDAPTTPLPAPAQPTLLTIEPLALPPGMGGAADEPVVLDLQPIPTAVHAQPRPVQPVARTRSSR